MGECGLNLSGRGQVGLAVAGCCEYGDETVGSIKCEGFLGYLRYSSFQRLCCKEFVRLLVVFPAWDCVIQGDTKGTWV
jgi:hypothetical protein